MKPKDYMTDTWCMLAGMPRPRTEFPDNSAQVEPPPSRHVLVRLLLTLLQIVPL
jgi:hypothetical protein